VKTQNYLRGRQVVFLASIDWGATWQRHQALAEAFALAGADVFFVENTGFRGPSYGDFSRVLGRIRRMSRPARRQKSRRIISPMVLPPTHKIFRLLNAVYFVPLLIAKLRKRGLTENPIVFAYLPTETTLQLIDGLKPETVVYDCVDNFHGHPTPPEDLRETEVRLLKHSALVLTTSSFLEDQKKALHSNVRRIHHGVNPAFVEYAFTPSTQYKRFCYFGTIWNALDYKAIAALASNGRTVDLIGPIKEPAPSLPDSVRILPQVAHDKLAKKLDDYDALILPYARTEYNKGVVPAKLYECLATGKPVLCSALPSLLEFDGLIEIAKHSTDFPKIAEGLADSETEEKRRRRMKVAADHVTERQVEKIESELMKSPPAVFDAASEEPKTGEVFLKGFTWIAIWFVTARVASLLAQFIAARWLGPKSFGVAHLVIALAAMLQTVASLGFPLAMTRFGAAASTPASRKKTISTTFICFILWATLVSAFLFGYGDVLSSSAKLSPRLWWYCAALAVFTALHQTIGGALQGLHRFRHRGIAESVYALAALAAVIVAIYLGFRSTEALIASILAGFTLGALYGFFQIRSYLQFSLSRTVMREILPFAILGTVNIFSLALIQAPGRIAAFYFDSPAAAGIYSIYFMATMQIALALGNMVQAVLVPIASREPGQEAVWSVLRTVNAPILAGTFSLFALGSAAALTLMGERYPMEPLWIALFAAAATLAILHGAMASAFAARDLKGLSISITGMLIAGVCNTAGNLILTPLWGVGGGGAALVLSYAAGLAWFAFEAPGNKRRMAK